MQELDCVFVGVGYRLAPEHPFPGPVDDCIDSLLWLSAHASEYSLDMSKTILSGFSAGANLAFTAPLRFEFFTRMHEQMLSVPSQASDLSRWPSTQALIDKSHLEEMRIISIIAWYPIVDWTHSRAEKRRMSRMPKRTLPKFFTDLFDYSYLPAPDVHGYHCSPYTSPGLAPDYMLMEGLPSNIQLWLCEYDMLLAEGERFADRLRKLGKSVTETMIPAEPHGFDLSANPFRDQPQIDSLYRKACDGVRDLLKQK
jgi:putative ergosteryl-3beta-O-L-aspartate hydrolase